MGRFAFVVTALLTASAAGMLFMAQSGQAADLSPQLACASDAQFVTIYEYSSSVTPSYDTEPLEQAVEVLDTAAIPGSSETLDVTDAGMSDNLTVSAVINSGGDVRALVYFDGSEESGWQVDSIQGCLP